MENSLVHEVIDTIVHPTPDQARFFLQGPAGTGKTTLAVRRVLHMVQNYVSAESILVLVPQPALGAPYQEAMWELDMPGGEITVATVGSLARQTIQLFWPVISERAGFGAPARDPVFLNMETTQYYMDRIAAPYIDAGYFEGLTIRRNRLVSQIIDNLTKAATVGFPHTEAAERLKQAWAGESAHKRLYDHAQICANAFRDYCLANNLLDFSLLYEVFFDHILNEPLSRNYLFGRYQHLIVDNVEEDTPRAHDLIRQWLPVCQTALVVMDQQSGYRTFLSADPAGAAELKSLCQGWLNLDQSHVMSGQVETLGRDLIQSLGSEVSALVPRPRPRSRRVSNQPPALYYEPVRFQPQMFQWIAQEIERLIKEEGVPPEEIVVLAPLLGDALRFALFNALTQRGIPVRSHRPSRALRDEPATRCLLTLAALGYPDWWHAPGDSDVAHALMVAIEGMDLVRARLLTEIVYRVEEGRPVLTSFDQIRSDTQQRIGYVLGEQFERLRSWLEAYGQALELDEFFRGLFSDILSQPGFGFYLNLDAGRVTSNLIDSVRRFRRVVGHTLPETISPGLAYVRMVEQGVLAATYVQNWQRQTAGAVFVAPAYTFLMTNRPADIQFWVDVGSGSWWERLYQPLTHPYVLTRNWPPQAVWTDEDEYTVRQMALGRLILGLVRRCRKRIYLGIADLGEQGYEQRGPLLQAVQRTLRKMPTAVSFYPNEEEPWQELE